MNMTPKEGVTLRFRPPIIVKVQIPIATSGPEGMVIVHDKERTVESMFPYTAQLRKTLRGRPKSFWYAHLVPNEEPRGTFSISLDRPAPWQEW